MFYSSMSADTSMTRKYSLKIRRQKKKKKKIRSHIKTCFMVIKQNKFLHRLNFLSSLYNLLQILQPMSCISTKHILFVQSIIKRTKK